MTAGPATTGYEGALEAVTGHKLELRDKISPPTGWLIPVSPGAAAWWNYYPFGVQLFGVDVNQGAIDAWHRTLDDLGSIANEVASGSYGLMQVPTLRDAQARAQSYQNMLATSSEHAHRIADPVLSGQNISGTAADMVGRMTRGVADALDNYHTTLSTAPSVAGALNDAAEGLADFGHRMAKAYFDSRDVLLNAVAEGINGTAADLTSYLALHDLATPDDVLLSYPSQDPERDSAQARQVLAGFSSQGRMPDGFDSPAGDPVSGALWVSASAAITKRLTDELDAMDKAADAALADLEKAYQAATTRFGGTATGQVRARTSTRLARTALAAPALPAQKATPLQPTQATAHTVLRDASTEPGPLATGFSTPVLGGVSMSVGAPLSRDRVEGNLAEPLQPAYASMPAARSLATPLGEMTEPLQPVYASMPAEVGDTTEPLEPTYSVMPAEVHYADRVPAEKVDPPA